MRECRNAEPHIGVKLMAESLRAELQECGNADRTLRELMAES
jgi:hypothetical protein